MSYASLGDDFPPPPTEPCGAHASPAWDVGGQVWACYCDKGWDLVDGVCVVELPEQVIVGAPPKPKAAKQAWKPGTTPPGAHTSAGTVMATVALFGAAGYIAWKYILKK
jgi:hypothetical protein